MAEMQAYLDFEIRISRSSEGLYEATASGEGCRARARFADPFTPDKRTIIQNTLTMAALRSSSRTRSSGGAELRSMREVGAELFNALLQPELKDAYYQVLGHATNQGKGVRLRLVLDESVSTLPWEFLCTPQQDFVNLNPETPIIRYIERPHPAPSVKIDLPLNVLVVIANPTRFSQLDAAGEKARIVQALAPLQEQGLVHVSYIEGPDTWPRLIDALRPDETHILHFIGHGTVAENSQTAEGLLVMEDLDGAAKLVGSELFRILVLGKKNLRLVMLNSCLGAAATEGAPLSSVAANLVIAGVPAVIAMQFEISDDAARTIAGTFYKCLAMKMPVDRALAEARRQVKLLNSDSLEWATPVLYMQVSNGQLFDFDEVPTRASTVTSAKVDKPQMAVAAQANSGTEEGWSATEFAAKNYQEGLKAQDRGDLEAAIRAFKGVKTIMPGYLDAETRLAESERRLQCITLYGKARQQLDQGDYRGAADTWAEVRKTDPNWPDTADIEILSACGLDYEEALRQLRLGNRELGAARLRDIVQRRPKFKDARARLQSLAEGSDGLLGFEITREAGSSERPDSIAEKLNFQRSYQVPSAHLEDLADRLLRHLQSQGLDAQTVRDAEGIAVQGRKHGWQRWVGMGQAVTIKLSPDPAGFTAAIGGGSWIEHGAAATVAIVASAGLLAVLPGIGAVKQKLLMDQSWRIIEGYVLERRGSRLER